MFRAEPLAVKDLLAVYYQFSDGAAIRSWVAPSAPGTLTSTVNALGFSIPDQLVITLHTESIHYLLLDLWRSHFHSNEPLNDIQTPQVQLLRDTALNADSDLDAQISKVLLSIIQLENERRQRNTYAETLKDALCPMRQIPSEILAEILIICRDDSLRDANYSVADPRTFPMLLGHISSRWRQVSRHTPRLWTHVQFPMNPPSTLLRSILARSRILPRHVDIEIDEDGVREAHVVGTTMTD
ncbi:hypothetical protein DFH09DRAFT_1372876 [Mycena vulgaris]|nr:hypothetical protein DFH09DRAFT_1372876 [Mycena vulgaris]